MNAETQQLERARARTGGRCAYCGIRQEAPMLLDFHRPLSKGGARDDDNALCCCGYCNIYKGGYWHETDPPHVPLLHPLRDVVADHVEELADGLLRGRTAVGDFYVERLRLNRASLIAARRERQRALELLRRAQQLDEELRAMLSAAEQR